VTLARSCGRPSVEEGEPGLIRRFPSTWLADTGLMQAILYLWADLMRRTFGLDVLGCPRCGGRLRLIALIDHPRVVERILRHLGLPTDRPEPRPARAPPDVVLAPEPQLIPGLDATF
jgi:hypothetical protein